MKRYIKSDSTGSLIDKLNGLPVYNGYSRIPSYKEIDMYKDILNVRVRTCVEIDLSCDASEAPEILIL